MVRNTWKELNNCKKSFRSWCVTDFPLLRVVWIKRSINNKKRAAKNKQNSIILKSKQSIPMNKLVSLVAIPLFYLRMISMKKGSLLCAAAGYTLI